MEAGFGDEIESVTEKEEEKKEITVLELQKTRMDLERDAQLLSNRISLLQQEQMKAQKKIKEAKKQTKEVLMRREKYEKRVSERAEIEERRRNDNKLSQKHFYETRTKRQEGIKSIQKELATIKQEEAQARKMERRQNDQRKEEIALEYAARNAEKKAKVREKEKITYSKVQKMHEEKRMVARQNYEEKKLREQMKIKKKEEQLAQMEHLENDLITQLRDTEQVQNDTLRKLESAIRESPGQRSSDHPPPHKDSV